MIMNDQQIRESRSSLESSNSTISSLTTPSSFISVTESQTSEEESQTLEEPTAYLDASMNEDSLLPRSFTQSTTNEISTITATSEGD